MFFPQIRRRVSYRERNYRGNVGYYVYTGYRTETREDCNRSCYYCDRHEDEVGGEEEFELDHFRPYSFPEFKSLENDPRNLVWSCHKCNNLKLEKWPARGLPLSHVNGEGFIDRFGTDDAADYFAVKDDGALVALKPPAQYIIDELKLDRDGLSRQRKVRINTAHQIREAMKSLDDIRAALVSASLPAEVIQTLSDLSSRFVRFLDDCRKDHEYLFHRIGL